MSNNDQTKVEASILTREFDAPMQLVFDAWTQVEHLNNWMFPKAGFTVEYLSADIRTGGSSLHKMTMPNGYEMWLLTEYDEVSPPDTLVFRQYMSNEAGEVVPNPQMPDWPKDMQATINLEEVDGKTLLKFIWEPVNPTAAEIAVFEASRAQHGEGWGAGLNQLTAYLESL